MTRRISSFSFANGNCVEADAAWRTSRFCSSDGCVSAHVNGVAWRNYSGPTGGNCVDAACTHGAEFRNHSTANGQCVDATCTHGAHFTKAALSFANGNCVEAAHVAGAEFASASMSNGHCVESADTAPVGGEVLVRDSKDPDGPHIHIPAAQWQNGAGLTFSPIRSEEVPMKLRAIALVREHEAGQQWFSVTDGTDTLYFDSGEVDAFTKGVTAKEFELA